MNRKTVLRAALLTLRRVAKALGRVCDLLGELEDDEMKIQCRSAETIVNGVIGAILLRLSDK